MKKKLISLALALCLVCSAALSIAAAAEADTKLETVRVLGILSGDAHGNLNLNATVTRAEFVKMMTAASVYKDTVGSGYGASLFRDVKSGHWASEYIKLAVEQGWVTGYVDGTFRPDNSITLEEACTALLRLLGYDSGSLAGSFPTAQLSKASAIGLLDDMTATQGQTLTRQNCVTLFYNLLTAQDSAGKIYGTTLGYTVTNGEVDYSALVTADTKGPYIAESGTINLPFGTENCTVYRDGAASTLSAVKQFDVYYYNTSLRTVWVYTKRVTGTLTAVSPSQAAPTSATVAGNTYDLGTSSVTYKFSSQGSFTAGDSVTLLLGMNGEVADVISAQSVSSIAYGVVLSSAKTAGDSTTTSSGTAQVQIATQIACTDGTARTFYHTGSVFTAGQVVSATTDASGTTLQRLSSRGLSGTVSSDASQFAGYAFAPNAEILDTDSEGSYVRVYPARLAGAALNTSNVLYYTLDENNEIDHLILRNTTGDTVTYVYITSAQSTNSEMSVSGTYQYLQNGTAQTISGAKSYSISSGGATLLYEKGSLKNMRQLTETVLTDLSDLYVMAGNRKYLLDETVQVLLRDSNASTRYYATTLSEINATDYTLTGWYDDLGYPAGGRIRILVATKK